MKKNWAFLSTAKKIQRDPYSIEFMNLAKKVKTKKLEPVKPRDKTFPSYDKEFVSRAFTKQKKKPNFKINLLRKGSSRRLATQGSRGPTSSRKGQSSSARNVGTKPTSQMKKYQNRPKGRGYLINKDYAKQ